MGAGAAGVAAEIGGDDPVPGGGQVPTASVVAPELGGGGEAAQQHELAGPWSNSWWDGSSPSRVWNRPSDQMLETWSSFALRVGPWRVRGGRTEEDRVTGS